MFDFDTGPYSTIFVDFYYPTSGSAKFRCVGCFPQRGASMVFLLRAVFWTAVVMVFVPGGPHGTGETAGLQTLASVREDALLTLARIRT
ncbi:MAG TPA: hypothetical protein VG324_18795, partial [Blastocatellia bacterium]|nr:hypothetical protein [Blastocatellia bacterium]